MLLGHIVFLVRVLWLGSIACHRVSVDVIALWPIFMIKESSTISDRYIHRLPRAIAVLHYCALLNLTKFPVMIRLRSGSGNLNTVDLLYHVLRCLGTMYIDWSLVRVRVTRRRNRP